MLHAMGFSHEQSRSDRDNFVTINLENIETGSFDDILHFILHKSIFRNQTSKLEFR